MSYHDYTYKGYSNQNGVGTYADDWTKTSYSSHSDHVYRPVLIDAEGRKRPIVSYNAPGEYYVSKTEVVCSSAYKQSLPARVEPVRTYGGVTEDKWGKPSSPAHRSTEDKMNKYSPVNGFSPKANEYNKVQGVRGGFPPSFCTTRVEPLGTNYGGATEKKWSSPISPVNHLEPVYGVPKKDKVRSVQRVEPVQTYGGVAEGDWGRPSSPVRYSEPEEVNEFINTGEKWRRPSSPVRHSEPEEVNEFINTGEKWRRPSSPVRHSEPEKFNGFNTEKKWRRPSSPVRNSEPEKFNEFINNIQTEASRPRFGPLSATYWRQTPPVTPEHGYGGDRQATTEPAMITSGGWSRPSHAAWSSPPEGSLTKPTNDINKATENLLESAKPSSGVIGLNNSRVTAPPSAGLRTDAAYTSTIDSREAAKRYGNFNLASSYPENEAYTQTIDSREAAKKYGGMIV